MHCTLKEALATADSQFQYLKSEFSGHDNTQLMPVKNKYTGNFSLWKLGPHINHCGLKKKKKLVRQTLTDSDYVGR